MEKTIWMGLGGLLNKRVFTLIWDNILIFKILVNLESPKYKKILK